MAEVQRKKDHIANLESDLAQYRLMEEDYEGLRGRFQAEQQKNDELSQVGLIH